MGININKMNLILLFLVPGCDAAIQTMSAFFKEFKSLIVMDGLALYGNKSLVLHVIVL